MGYVENAFGEKVKVYLLNSCANGYEAIKAQAIADPAANKIIVTEDCDHHKIKMQHSFKVPQWILDVFPDYTGACTDDYVNIGLDALHNTEKYKTDGNAQQTIDEIQTITYRTIFGSLYCATSEESVQHASTTEQYVAGALHEVIATVDVDELITGLFKMGKGIISSNQESQEAFYTDVKQTLKDLASGTPITNQQLVQRLMPPELRNNVKIITTAYNVSRQFVHFYFTGCDNYQFRNGSPGPICPYRYGQITVMIIPIILTGGEWAFAKAGTMAVELGSLVQKAAIIKVSEQTTADIINLLKDAEQTGKTVAEEANKILIKEGDNLVASVEKDGGEVKVLKGEAGVQQAGTLVQYVGKVTKGIKNLLPLETPKGLFRQLKGTNGEIYRAATFWKDEGADIMHYLSQDAKYYIKHDPTNGTVLFIDVQNNKFMGFMLDQENIIGTNYNTLLENLKTIHGLPNSVRTVNIKGTVITFADDKANLILGKYKPNNSPGISGEIGTDDLIDQMTILKNYSFADKYFELRNGSVHVLNIPDGNVTQWATFFEDYNKQFLNLATQNPNSFRTILVSDPRKAQLLRAALVDGKYVPSGFAKEIKYLRDRGIKNVTLKDRTNLNLDDIDLSNLNWSGWQY